MSTEPVIHCKQRRVVVVASKQPLAAPAPAIAEAKTERPVLEPKARSTPPSAAPAPAGKVAVVAAAAASLRQEPLSEAERKRRQAAKADAAIQVLAGHFPNIFTSVRPMAIGTGKVLDAERKAGRLPLGCIPLKLALAAWTASDAYLEALTASGARFNLTGEVAGEVTPEQAARAARKLQKRRDAAAKRHDA